MHIDFYKKLSLSSLALWGAIAAVLIYGDQVQTSVEYFSVEHKEVSPYTQQLSFEFNRSVDSTELEKTFSITPAADLELSWVGKRMVVSLKEPLMAGRDYAVTLGTYEGTFSTRQQELFYIDTSGETRQIFSYQLASGETKAMTPENLLVTDYQITQDGNKVVFFATPKEGLSEGGDYSLFPNLYELDLERFELTQLSSDDERSLNMTFRLSPDGKNIFLHRLNLAKDGTPQGMELLLSQDGGRFKPFWKQDLVGITQDSIDFTADSQFIVAHDWNRFTILPLEKGAYPEQDLGDYVETLGFTDAGNRLLFLKWKDENPFALSNELVVFDETGGQEILLQDLGVMDEAEMSADGEKIIFTMEALSGSELGIYLSDLDVGLVRRLDADNLFYETQLDLSLDETWLSYASQLDVTEESGGELWIMNIETGENSKLIQEGRLPKWRP